MPQTGYIIAKTVKPRTKEEKVLFAKVVQKPIPKIPEKKPEEIFESIVPGLLKSMRDVPLDRCLVGPLIEKAFKRNPRFKIGHSSVKTTQIYTHVSREEIGKIRSPLASLMSLNKKDSLNEESMP
jgi:hypothetical protein